MRCFCRLVLLSILLFVSSWRGFSTEQFEPADGKVIYGMGQELNRFYILPDDNLGVGETKAAVDEVFARSGRKPLLLSGYTSIGPVTRLENQLNRLQQINQTEGEDYKLLLGVAMHDVELFEALFAGDLDADLLAWGNHLKDIQTFIFIRPLYEISAGDHFPYVNGYAERHSMQPGEVAANAFRRIVDKVREGAGVPLKHVAWMWHPWPLGYDYTMTFYPGDDYVDWIGTSWFTFDPAGSDWQNHMGDINRIAEERNKPIMVAESGPCWAWESVPDSDVIRIYFAPYFDMLEQYDRVKAFMYINSDWSVIAWLNWPDFRLISRPEVLDYFGTRLLNPAYDVSSEIFSVTPTPVPPPTHTPTPCLCVPETGHTFVEAEGRIVIEAEHYYSLEQRDDNADWFLSTAAPGYGCEGGMEAPEAASNATWTTGARMNYRIRIHRPGYYSVELRRNIDAYGTGSNSCFIGFDGVQLLPEVYDNASSGGEWLWMRNGQTYITKLSAGYHTFTIVRREIGYRVDRFVISCVGLPREGSNEVGPCESASDPNIPTPTPEAPGGASLQAR